MTAATEAFEADLDLVVALGWAHIERHAYRTLLQEAQAAPDALKAPLQLLAILYGLTRLERSLAHYLAAGVMQGGSTKLLFGAAHKMQLMEQHANLHASCVAWPT